MADQAALELFKKERRKQQNRISQRKRRKSRNWQSYHSAHIKVGERRRECKKQAQPRRPEPAHTERGTTWHDPHVAPREQQSQEETALTGRVDHPAPAPASSDGDLAVQTSTCTSPSPSWVSPRMAEYTSPFEDGYALLNGGPIWDCPQTAGTRKDEGTEHETLSRVGACEID